MRTKHTLVSVLILFFFIGDLYAGGADLNVVPGAKTLSLDGLYFAGGDGLNSILGNPAGLIKTSNKFLELSIADLIGQQKFESDIRGLHKSYEEDHFALGGGFAWAFSPDFILGVSYQRAINYNVDWPFLAYQYTDSTSSISSLDLYNRFKVNAASLSGAVRFSQLTIGVTISAYQVKQETAFPLENRSWYDSLSIGLAAYQFNYNEDAWTYGFDIGLLYDVSPDLQVGVMARSGYSADLSGTARSRYFADLDSAASEVDLSSKFEIPWVFGGGLVYKLSESLTINADLQYSMWSNTQKSMDFDFSNSVWQNNLPLNDSLSGIRADKFMLDFQNTIDAGIGLNLKLSDLDLRFGYRFSQSPNSESTYSYLFPAVDQHRISIGLGYVDENLSADLSVAYAFGTEKEINNTAKGFNGKYNGSLVIPVLTIRYSL